MKHIKKFNESFDINYFKAYGVDKEIFDNINSIIKSLDPESEFYIRIKDRRFDEVPRSKPDQWEEIYSDGKWIKTENDHFGNEIGYDVITDLSFAEELLNKISSEYKIKVGKPYINRDSGYKKYMFKKNHKIDRFNISIIPGKGDPQYDQKDHEYGPSLFSNWNDGQKALISFTIEK